MLDARQAQQAKSPIFGRKILKSGRPTIGLAG
jgi:hypothetical protein